MLKPKVIFIASVALLGVLLAFTVFRPLTLGEECQTVMRESVIEGEGEWIIQISLINKEGVDSSYIIEWATGEETCHRERVLIKDGRTFTNIHHFYPETVKEGEIHLTIYREGEPEPLEQATYYIKFD
jgi:hypothetical protein